MTGNAPGHSLQLFQQTVASRQSLGGQAARADWVCHRRQSPTVQPLIFCRAVSRIKGIANPAPLTLRFLDILWVFRRPTGRRSKGQKHFLCRLANLDRRVRCIQRIGRRGLASACVEGILASSAPYVAVMDADLQHDEQLLPHMLTILKTDQTIDVVVGSRHVEHGSTGDWNRHRVWLSSVATRIGRSILRVPVGDPMSGFFMVRREAFQGSMRRLSNIGFKILLDILASSPRPLQVKEIPFHFRERLVGESKFDALIGWEYLMLLVD